MDERRLRNLGNRAVCDAVLPEPTFQVVAGICWRAVCFQSAFRL